MFIDKNKYPFLSNINKNIDVIINELQHAINNDEKVQKAFTLEDYGIEHYTDYWVKDNGFHPEQIGYDIRKGDYSTFAIYKKDFPIKNIDINTLFPNTLELLKDIPNLYYSGFFKMNSKTELSTHKHTRSHLIYHVLLNDLEDGQCTLTCGTETKKLTKKETVFYLTTA